MSFHYMRYCDDLLIICKSKDVVYLNNSLITEIKDRYRLAINQKKTEVIEFRANHCGKIRGFDIKNQRGGNEQRRLTSSNFIRICNTLDSNLMVKTSTFGREAFRDILERRKVEY